MHFFPAAISEAPNFKVRKTFFWERQMKSFPVMSACVRRKLTEIAFEFTFDTDLEVCILQQHPSALEQKPARKQEGVNC